VKPKLSAVAQTIIRLAAEAGWMSVVYSVAVVTFDRRAPALGPIEFAGLVGIGVLVGRYGRPRPDVGTVMLLAAAIGAGAVGWLASDEARSLLSVDPARALGLHLAGWLGALALLRGVVIRTGSAGVRQTEDLLRTMLPIVALVWAFATITAPTVLQMPFSITAIWGTVVLIAAGLLALGLGRLALLHAAVADRRTRRRWQWLVVGSGLTVAPLAAPFVVLSGIPVSGLVGPIVGPVQAVVGLVQAVVGLVAYPMGLLVEWLIDLLRPIVSPLAPLLDELERRLAARPQGEATDPPLLLTVLGVSLALITALMTIAIVLVLLHWLLVRRPRENLDDSPLPAGEEHAIVVPSRRPRPLGTRAGRTPRPVRDAVTAYLNALVELDRHPPFARHPTETPAQHAARTRAAGMPASEELARLAAGYQLARYGGRVLTRSEDRRAISRFERIRRSLRALLRR
jgi:hypothetical protein